MTQSEKEGAFGSKLAKAVEAREAQPGKAAPEAPAAPDPGALLASIRASRELARSLGEAGAKAGEPKPKGPGQ